jgi:hypothetical protein
VTDNVDVVRRFVDAFEPRQANEAVALAHESITLRPALRPGRALYIGHAGVRERLAELQQSFGHYSLACDHTVELDDDKTEVRGRLLPTGADEIEFVCVVTVRDGLVVDMETT